MGVAAFWRFHGPLASDVFPEGHRPFLGYNKLVNSGRDTQIVHGEMSLKPLLQLLFRAAVSSV
jgi:hypothetical protein